MAPVAEGGGYRAGDSGHRVRPGAVGRGVLARSTRRRCSSPIRTTSCTPSPPPSGCTGSYRTRGSSSRPIRFYYTLHRDELAAVMTEFLEWRLKVRPTTTDERRRRRRRPRRLRQSLLLRLLRGLQGVPRVRRQEAGQPLSEGAAARAHRARRARPGHRLRARRDGARMRRCSARRRRDRLRGRGRAHRRRERCATYPPDVRERAQVRQMNARALEFDDESFDVAFMSDIVEHLYPQELAEALRRDAAGAAAGRQADRPHVPEPPASTT